MPSHRGAKNELLEKAVSLMRPPLWPAPCLRIPISSVSSTIYRCDSLSREDLLDQSPDRVILRAETLTRRVKPCPSRSESRSSMTT